MTSQQSNLTPPQHLCITCIRAYQIISRVGRPLTATLFPMSACRFSPTCSEYAIQAIARHGLSRGFALSLKRLSRCHPGNPGGADPVPS